MSKIKDELLKKIEQSNSTPFFFVGSGISRRYLDLPNWEGLLRKFAEVTSANEFGYDIYFNEARTLGYKVDINPKIAELIENDFNKLWYTKDEYAENRSRNREFIKRNISPFKIELGEYFKQSSEKMFDAKIKEEINLLKEVGKKSIAGVITTNYDLLMENIFEDYKVYTSQEELVFSQIQETAEIYKIHGCCTKPETIIINDVDYYDFNSRNAYLASKLLTIFIEHPIIFIGYSISDKDIEEILRSIINCLSKENLVKLKDRLIFIEWNNTNEPDEVATYSKSFENDKIIEMTRIKIKDYSEIYRALLSNKVKYNPRVLRKLKKDIYDLVLTNDPTDKIKVVGIEDGESLEDVEVVIGVGILKEFGIKGYGLISAEEIYKDVVFDNGNYNNELIVKESLPVLLKHHANSIPIYKYISKYKGELPEQVQKEIKIKYDELLSSSIKNRTIKEKSIREIREKHGDKECLQFIPVLHRDLINLDDLENYLKYIFEKYPDILQEGKQAEKTDFRRLIKIYDWLKYYNAQRTRTSSD